MWRVSTPPAAGPSRRCRGWIYRRPLHQSTIATTMKAVQSGRGDHVDGIFALCPFISNAYAEMPDAFPSMKENDGYFVRCDMLDVLASLYDGAGSMRPLAWPSHADVDALRGMPPTMISVNEMDPLRDEGVAFHAKLKEAGVEADIRTVPATTHAAAVVFQAAAPDISAATVESIRRFTYGL